MAETNTTSAGTPASQETDPQTGAGAGVPAAQTAANANQTAGFTAELKAEMRKMLEEMGIGGAPAKEKPAQPTAADSETAQLRNYVEAVKAGVPYEKADKYARLAETYVDDKTDFAAALRKAIEDFPFAPPAVAAGAAGTSGQDGSASQNSGVPDEEKIHEIFRRKG